MNNLNKKVKELAKKVYKKMGGFGWYQEDDLKHALAQELRKAGLPYFQEFVVPIFYGDQQIKLGEIDFIVFDKKGKNGCLVEIKHAGDLDGSPIHQAMEYYKAIKEQKCIPSFLKGKIKGVIVFNWNKNSKALFDSYLEKQNKKKEEIAFSVDKPLEGFEPLFKDIEIFEIVGDKKTKKNSKNTS